MNVHGFSRTLLIAAALEIIFSASSPIAFGGLADDYFARAERLHPPGSSASQAANAMVADGMTFSSALGACGRVRSCYATAVTYAGGNPLCSYWHVIMLQTNGWYPSAVIEKWIRIPNQMTCFWSGVGGFYGRPAVLIGSLRAEFGIR